MRCGGVRRVGGGGVGGGGDGWGRAVAQHLAAEEHPRRRGGGKAGEGGDALADALDQVVGPAREVKGPAVREPRAQQDFVIAPVPAARASRVAAAGRRRKTRRGRLEGDGGAVVGCRAIGWWRRHAIAGRAVGGLHVTACCKALSGTVTVPTQSQGL
jgi:hypothetical protein